MDRAQLLAAWLHRQASSSCHFNSMAYLKSTISYMVILWYHTFIVLPAYMLAFGTLQSFNVSVSPIQTASKYFFRAKTRIAGWMDPAGLPTRTLARFRKYVKGLSAAILPRLSGCRYNNQPHVT